MMKLFAGFLQSTIAMQILALCDVTDLICLLSFLNELQQSVSVIFENGFSNIVK